MRTRNLTAVLLALGLSLGALPAAALPTGAPDPAAGPLADVAQAAGADLCDDSDAAHCLLPFPNDHFSTPDATTVTGRRIAISPLVTPQNAAGRPIDTTEQNRNDGFSPGGHAMTFVPRLDLGATWAAALGAGGTAPATEQDLARSLHPDSPIVVVDAETGERHPFFDELDTHAETGDDERLLLVRPAVNWTEGHRYVIGLRDLRDAAGQPIAPSPAFAAYLQGRGAQPAKQAHLDADVLPVLDAAGVERDELVLAWDFTVASWQSLAGRVLHMRDEAFAQLGDLDLADLEVDGVAPPFTVDYVDEDNSNAQRIVHGAVTVPNFLQLPQQRVDTGRISDDGRELPATMVPGSRLVYLDGDELPDINPVARTMEIPFSCAIPLDATAEDPARIALYGHGLLGQRYEGAYFSGGRHMLRNHGLMNCGVDWLGMSTEDLANVALILTDGSNMASLADRGLQGFLGFLLVGRAMLHPDGFAAHPAWQDAEGRPLIDTDELVYDGNSQGAIMGGALTAIAPDFTKAVLGVPGMNYSTLLNRSVDWEGALLDPADPDLPAYSQLMYRSYTDPQERQLVFALIQMLWDRSESNGYAAHMTDDPYPGTPAHRILLHTAFGDFQVANVAAEVMARTAGAHLLGSSVPARHTSVDPAFGLPGFAGERDGLPAHDGSAMVYLDSGNAPAPVGNRPPAYLGSDPHNHPRNDVPGGIQKSVFFDTGVVIDPRAGAPWVTKDCPAVDRAAYDPGIC